jgi:hypothetical protein
MSDESRAVDGCTKADVAVLDAASRLANANMWTLQQAVDALLDITETRAKAAECDELRARLTAVEAVIDRVRQHSKPVRLVVELAEAAAGSGSSLKEDGQ